MNHTGKMLLILGFSLSALAGPPAYKWVDPEGVVHYFEKPPENVTCEPIELDEPLSEEQAAAARGIYEQVIKELAARRAADLRARQERRMTREQREAVSDYMANHCVKASRNLLVLGIQRPVYYDDTGEVHCHRSMHSNWYEGERRYLDDEERSVLQLVWSGQFLKFCEPDPTGKEIEQRVDAWMRLRTMQHCDYWRASLAKARQRDSDTPSGEIEKLETRLERYCY